MVHRLQPPTVYRLLAAATLLLLFTVGLRSIGVHSPTADEPAHLTRGVTIWQTGDFRFQLEHTPLSHWLIGSLLQLDPSLPDVTTLPGWENGQRLPAARALVWQSDLNVETLFWLGRLPILLLTLLCGAMVWRWATALGGRWAGLTAGLLFAVDPNLLAHGALATTDLTAAAGYLIALFALWRWTQHRSTIRLITAGIALGIGIAAKMTGALLVPLALVIVWQTVGPRRSVRPLTVLLSLAALVVWATYRFTIGPVMLPLLDRPLTLPGPAYWTSLLGVNDHVSGGHPAFFLGEISAQGWYGYFPLLLLIKTTLPLLALMGAAPLLTGRRLGWGKTIFFWLPAVLLLGLAIFSRLNIGYRHILPIIPLLLIGSAAVVIPWLITYRWGKTVVVASLLATTAVQLWLAPHHLAYFNWLVGGPTAGGRFVGDSNLDWGQDWLLASRAIEQNRANLNPFVVPFGFIDPAYYGLAEFNLLDEAGYPQPDFAAANPAAGRYYLSLNALQGLLPEPDMLDYFRRRPPQFNHEIGYAIAVYDIVAPHPGSWIAHCTQPGPLLEPAAAEQLVGQTDLRHTYFDCQRSWVFPDEDNQAAGWYIVPADFALDPWLAEEAGNALNLVYIHRATSAAPAYAVYHWSAAADPRAWLADPPPSAPAPLVVPLGFARPSVNSWIVGWEIAQTADAPLSFLAHLYTDGPTPAGVDDGLGYTVDQWQAGDLFLQFHHFSVPAGDMGTLHTGPYRPENGERLQDPVLYPPPD